VLMVIRIRLACSEVACSISRTRYSARIGSISPSMWSSTTAEFAAGADAAGGAVCARSDAKAISVIAASAEESSGKRRTARGNISRVIIATEAAGAVMFRWRFGVGCRMRLRLGADDRRHARQASRQPKRRQAAALQDGLLSSRRWVAMAAAVARAATEKSDPSPASAGSG
jgi:hypothetical protein